MIEMCHRPGLEQSAPSPKRKSDDHILDKRSAAAGLLFCRSKLHIHHNAATVPRGHRASCEGRTRPNRHWIMNHSTMDWPRLRSCSRMRVGKIRPPPRTKLPVVSNQWWTCQTGVVAKSFQFPVSLLGGSAILNEPKGFTYTLAGFAFCRCLKSCVTGHSPKCKKTWKIRAILLRS